MWVGGCSILRTNAALWTYQRTRTTRMGKCLKLHELPVSGWMVAIWQLGDDEGTTWITIILFQRPSPERWRDRVEYSWINGLTRTILLEWTWFHLRLFAVALLAATIIFCVGVVMFHVCTEISRALAVVWEIALKVSGDGEKIQLIYYFLLWYFIKCRKEG